MAGKEDRSLVLPRKIARNWKEINLAEAMEKIRHLATLQSNQEIFRNFKTIGNLVVCLLALF